MTRGAVAAVIAALVVGPLACEPGAPADSASAGPHELALVGSGSRIWFTAIRDNADGVPGVLTGLSGLLDVRHESAWVEIPLAALATGDEERDRNLRLIVFEVDRYPLARVVVTDVRAPDGLPPVGRSITLEATATVELRDSRRAMDIALRLSREGPRRIRVMTREPLTLRADDFGMRGALSALRMVCGARAISGAVPVHVDLLFEG